LKFPTVSPTGVGNEFSPSGTTPVCGADNRFMEQMRRRFLRLTERGSWALGLVGLATWASFQASVAVSVKQDVQRFSQAHTVNSGTSDESGWSAERITAWHLDLPGTEAVSIAILRIPRLDMELPVRPGTDDATLARAVGHIDGTALPGEDGNIGLAAHRDTHFRPLKHIVPGDVIELQTPAGTDVYRVERTWIVDPDDVSVIAPTSSRAVTLVTCYPFNFVGSAPRRFIVRAVPAARLATQAIAERVQKWSE
jgi:sortase A